MPSEVEERPKLVTASYGQYGSQWVEEGVDIIFNVDEALFPVLPSLSHLRGVFV